MLWGEARGVAKTATMPNPSSCEHDDGENGEMDGNPNLNWFSCLFESVWMWWIGVPCWKYYAKCLPTSHYTFWNYLWSEHNIMLTRGLFACMESIPSTQWWNIWTHIRFSGFHLVLQAVLGVSLPEFAYLRLMDVKKAVCVYLRLMAVSGMGNMRYQCKEVQRFQYCVFTTVLF